ncbi:TonB-dependent receptor [Membranihabitans marinus]|uniref:TonB-dependent receptor n=1 Tax=Membranihabitans marinus TaxID=1227546 RepID=UPI0033876145
MFLFWSVFLSGQNNLVGTIFDEENKALPGVTVLVENTDYFSITDDDGVFEIHGLEAGNYRILASYLGYEDYVSVVKLPLDQKSTLRIVLKEQALIFDQVRISAQSEAADLKTSSQSVSVLETKTLYNQSNNTADILNKISGVKVRQSGGLGSNADIFINGMSGKQIKFFMDGIPLSYFGSGMSLNVLPINIMERIEVYKGMVPVNLGADALGGAINVVTRQDMSSYLDLSYSMGSFNTHKGNFSSQYSDLKKGWFVGLQSFVNHSDNNYKVDVEIPDEFGNPQSATVNRFHDDYTNYMVNFQMGLFDKKWVDRMAFGARISGTERDIQHNAVMAQPYGQAHNNENTKGINLEYAFETPDNSMRFKWFGAINYTSGYFVDTTLNAYTWDGEVYQRRTDGGELSASRNLLSLDSKGHLSRFNWNYNVSDNSELTLNVFTSWFHRVGEDPLAAAFYGEDFYKNPVSLFKNATGLAYQHYFFDRKLSTYTSLKHFSFKADGYAIQNLEYIPNQQEVSKFGYSQAIRYQLSDHWSVKSSYEYATRLPDESELFGDFILVRPNPFLNPEVSHNLNVEGSYDGDKYHAEIRGFYRFNDDVIWLRTSQFFAQYQNLLRAEIRGVEMAFTYLPIPSLSLGLNGTFQDLRNKSSNSSAGTVDNRYYNARLPNIPYLFGNARIRYTLEDFVKPDCDLQLYWSGSYVREFYLYWAVDGNEEQKNIIPSQFVQNAGVSWLLQEQKFSIAAEIHNLGNIKAYDNFSVQRPGRSFYITLRTFLKK